MGTATANPLLARRLELGRTRRAIALAIGVTERAVWQWERGQVVPQGRLHAAIAAAYEVDLATAKQWIGAA